MIFAVGMYHVGAIRKVNSMVFAAFGVAGLGLNLLAVRQIVVPGRNIKPPSIKLVIRPVFGIGGRIEIMAGNL